MDTEKWNVIKEDEFSKTFSNGCQLVRIPKSLITELQIDKTVRLVIE